MFLGQTPPLLPPHTSNSPQISAAFIKKNHHAQDGQNLIIEIWSAHGRQMKMQLYYGTYVLTDHNPLNS